MSDVAEQLNVALAGRYRIGRELGTGGMATVFLAEDLKHHRQVAIKVLSPELATAIGPERFLREIELAARLAHPHILPLHDSGEAGGLLYYVMPYVEGESLRQRLEREKQLPLADALRIAREVADALDFAHRRGLVHRDIKPGNVMLLEQHAVVADFGIARAIVAAGGDKLTTTGLAVGTPAYMSPEQGAGSRDLDGRSDLYSLGCVLYEMLSGQPPFTGPTAESLVHQHLSLTPRPVTDLRPAVPEGVARAIQRTLAKAAADRFTTAAELAAAITAGAELGVANAVADAPARSRRPRSRRTILVVAVAIAVLGLASLAYIAGQISRPVTGPVQFSVALARGQALGGYAQAAISPDGRNLAFAAHDSAGIGRLWMRSLEALTSRVLPGTEGAFYPFWSPDSRFIGFFSRGHMKKVPVSGGPVEVICQARAGRGASWNRQNLILFAPSTDGPLFAVSGEGGVPTLATALDSTLHDVAHRWPSFLPDGRHFLFMALPGKNNVFDTYVGALGTHFRRRVTGASTAATYASPGYLLFLREDVLTAQRFDRRALHVSGEPRPLAVVPRVLGALGEPNVSASNRGSLVYVNSDLENTRLVWANRNGRPLEDVLLPAGAYFAPRLSPDGKQVAVERAESGTASDVWTIDLVRGIVSRSTFDPSLDRFPQWSPDAHQLVFASNRGGAYNLYRVAANGVGADVALATVPQSLLKWPTDWSRDGKFVVYDSHDSKTGYDIWIVQAQSRSVATPFRRTPFNEAGGRVSPDGRWMAYVSDESGEREVYLEPFPGGGARQRISAGGGELPRWRADGKEILYLAPGGRLMAVTVGGGETLHPTVPAVLLHLRNLRDYDIAPDGRRLLCLLVASEDTPASELSVVLNWSRAIAP